MPYLRCLKRLLLFAFSSKKNSDFLNTYRLELSFPIKEKQLVADALEQANENYVVEYNISESSRFVKFEIYIPTTGFANGYYLIGVLIQQHVLSKRK